MTTVLIGFDFGTHSTKVVCRERTRTGTDASIVVFDKPSPGYPSTASPSLVCIDQGKLYFGSEALARKSGKLYRSLKVELIPGMQRPQSEFPQGVDSKLLITAYLAWAFQRVQENLGEFEDARKLLNISAPMDHFKSDHLCNSYLSMLQAAWKLGFDECESTPIEQGIELHRLRSILKPLLAAPLESESMRPYGVMPETIAPIVSVSLDPLSNPGMYAVVDIGAATTEVSIFHLGDAGIGQKVLCYQDTTRLLGGNDLNANSTPAQVASVVEAVRRQFQETWVNGFQIDGNHRVARKRWCQLEILLSGGGVLHPAMLKFLTQFNPIAPWQSQGDLLGPVKWQKHVPTALGADRTVPELELSFYAVANGLAIDESKWPEIHQDVKRLPPPAQGNKPDGYW
jgi:hypothetical protein